ncbi:MAG: hypothetical protein DI565_06325 [Ancylobacter novellus]|uniref:Uncharacterized protein n=1 Tax=Ancylobacter novellus TaxID=921 RepID=A0A2W5KLS8_ANCNO|nr:MAG: hypothetical protein DI565_06325 [Ancylobacter novellus]
MGLVLAFETTPRRASARPAAKRAAPAKPADILLFTGVRYERDADHAGRDRRSAEARPDGAHSVS